MGRVPRSKLRCSYFHVFSRGIGEVGHIFRDNADRHAFIELIWSTSSKHGWICHAFCLLGTHYHLVLETGSDALSAGLHGLNWRYAMYFNRKHGRFGHLFANRFSARAIEGDEYLYDACAYVLQNPVQAGLCDRTEDWPWSYSTYELSAG